MKRKYLVTGFRGMLGREVMAQLDALGETAFGVDLPEVDLAEAWAVRHLLESLEPTHIIHCAAYTNVDAAESDREACFRANVTATLNLAESAARFNARITMLSTDYVFDGTSDRPYHVDDATCPINYYGQTKREGECALARALADHQIVRTAWLYGAGKRNFVAAILEKLGGEVPLEVVADQTGSPTYTRDLSRCLIQLSSVPETGIFHLVNQGSCSWFDFARRIAMASGHDPERIQPVESAKWKSAARRPAWSVLDCSRAHGLGVGPMRSWAEAVDEFVALKMKAAPEIA